MARNTNTEVVEEVVEEVSEVVVEDAPVVGTTGISGGLPVVVVDGPGEHDGISPEFKR